MNGILQQRIEEAAAAIAPFNRMSQKRDYFVKGATFALQNQWISVDEALPEKEQCVLVAVLDTIENEYNYGFDAVTDSTEVVTDEHGFRIWADTDRITHWMPIPELPKGGKE